MYSSLDDSHLEKRILNVLENIIAEVSRELKIMLAENIIYPDIEILVNGKSTDLISKSRLCKLTLASFVNNSFIFSMSKTYFL